MVDPGTKEVTDRDDLLLRDGLRMRPGEVDEEQETFRFLTEVLGKVNGFENTNAAVSSLPPMNS